jgi:molybdopterin synthase catalytic subunit
MSLLAILRDPLSIEALAAAVSAVARDTADGCGAIATFIGVVRGQHLGRRVQALEYEAYEPLAIHAFEQIQRETAAEWPGVVVGMHHRVGRLAVGETSVLVAAAAPHRDEACRACRYAIERVKQIAPVWKREFFDEGDMWLEGALADPQDDGARQAARARACA